MAYNPFDDVIDQDPAYMADGGSRSSLVKPVTTDQGPRYISQAIAKAYSALTPEEETLQEIEKNKQLRELATAQALMGTKYEEFAGQSDLPSYVIQSPGIKERLDQAGYQPQSFKEGVSRIGQFFYGDQRKAFDKLSQGQELTQEDRNAIAFSPLDTLDFLFPPLALKKLASLGFKNVTDVLKASDDIAEVKQVKDYFGGAGFIPEGVVRQAEKGEGLISSQTPPGKGVGTGQRYKETGLPKDIYFKSYIKPEQAKDIEKLADILNKTSIEDMNKPLKQIMVDNNLDSLLRVESKAKEKEKIVPAQFVKQTLKRYEMVPEEKLNKLTEITTKQPYRGGQQDKEKIQKFLEDSIESGKTFNFEKDMAKEVGMTGSKFATILFRNPSLKKLSKDLIEDTSSFSVEKYLKKNKDELGLTAINSRGNKNDRNEYLLFDGLIRSLSAQDIGLKPGATRREKTEKFIDYIKENIPDWKNVFREELNNLAYVDQQRNVANKTIKEMFNDYAERFPKQFKNENLNEYLLQVSHNYPLREDLRIFKGGGADIDSVRLAPSRTNNVHHAKIEKEVTKLKNKIEQQGKATEQQMKELKKLDQQAKELGTLVYTKIGDEYVAIGTEKAPGINTIVNSIEKYFQEISKRKGPGRIIKGEIIPLKFKEKQIKVKGKYGDILEPRPFQKGGAVKMALGGDPLENINQQQFASDPAMNEDYFQQAIQSGNLYAFNPLRLFEAFKKVPGMLTSKKVLDMEQDIYKQAIDRPSNLPAMPTVDPGDFPFKSYFLEVLTDPNSPKAAKGSDWINYLSKGKNVTDSELRDAGILEYIEDAEKFLPGVKIKAEDLRRVYENSPIANIEIKVKEGQPIRAPGDIRNEYATYAGGPKHYGVGSQPMDESGQNYRNIVINVKNLPGETEPFYNHGHYSKDPNVLAFTRVADYKNAEGDTVAVIQEMQTDLLTNLKKEQERVKASVQVIRNQKQQYKDRVLANPQDQYLLDQLERIEIQYPEAKLKFLESSNLVRPTDPEFAQSLAPEIVQELKDIQKEIDALVTENRGIVKDPNYLDKVAELQAVGLEKFNKLNELNRQQTFDDMIKDVKITDLTRSDDLAQFAQTTDTYRMDRKIKPFPTIPFNKGADWIDMMLKATIQDAQSKGINKVAIMPSDLINQRWGKDPNSEAGRKFKTIYDQIGVQELKNIAKKYTGDKNNLKIETIIDPEKSERGLNIYQRDVDGEYFLSKQDQLARNISFGEQQLFIDGELARMAHAFGADNVIYVKEVAPGQTMDYWVNPVGESQGIPRGDRKFELVPVSPGEDINAALAKIEEYNPQETKMYTITLPQETTKQGPMFLFRKKDGGKINSDGLVSITDIYGDY